MIDSAARAVLIPWRFSALGVGLVALLALLVSRLFSLQVLDTEYGYRFLQDQGDARTLRTETIPAHRGIIADRHGTPLAVSTPVKSIWTNPQELLAEFNEWDDLARLLDMSPDALRQRVSENSELEFLYLRRRLAPAEADAVLEREIPGIYAVREYQRFYPAAEVAAHVVGVTDIDDGGQEGIELAFNEWLQGEAGAKQVLKDRNGHIIKNVKPLRAVRPGKDLQLAMDLRLQYLAYRELKKAVLEHGARGGSVVLVDTTTGEVLAIANQPSYNPNRRSELLPQSMRNRAMTDLLEPGSTVKPLTILAALESGRFSPKTVIDTSPGYLRVETKTFLDPRDYGVLDLAGVLTKSSQVGISKIALDLEQGRIRDVLSRAGFGQATATGFPGESVGILPNHRRWSDIQRANLAFGYGLSATPIQIARAYATLASNGRSRAISLVKVDGETINETVFDQGLVNSVRVMLETVTGASGTGSAASVPGYRVAGKTGTVHKAAAGGYSKDKYLSLFAGFAPASRPRLAAVVVIDEPSSGEYFGGKVAAPVFSRVIGNALRLMNVAPDNLDNVAGADTNTPPRQA